MIWLVSAICLALGVVIGVVFASRFSASPVRIRDLESQIKKLQEQHSRYREDVSDHFSTTAELVQQMTESYKDVYQHLASGAQDLCSGEVAKKLLPASSDPVFDMTSVEEVTFTPPKDYAAKQSPQQKGALAEDFGLDKSKSQSRDDQLL